MNFSESISSKNPENTIIIDEASLLADWPGKYYEERNPAIRLRMLERAIEEGLDPNTDSIRKQIFERRYEKNQYADGGYADNFIKCFMEFSMFTKENRSLFSMKKARKNVLKYLSELGIESPVGDEDKYYDLLLKEFCHVGQLYIAISADSRQYRSVLFGFGKISDAALTHKLHIDLAAASIDVANKMDMHKEMELWLKGIERARSLMIPDTDPFI